MLITKRGIIRTYSPKTQKLISLYPKVMKESWKERNVSKICRKFGIKSDSIIRYWINRTYTPRVFKELRKCKWLPLNDSNELAYLCGFLVSDGHLNKNLITSRFFNRSEKILRRIVNLLYMVFGKINLTFDKSKKITTIYTDSLVARAFYLCGVPKGDKR